MPSAIVLCSCLPLLAASTADEPARERYFAPIDVQLSGLDKELVVLSANGRRLIVVDAEKDTLLREMHLPGPGSDLVVCHDKAYVSVSQPAGEVLLIDLRTKSVLKRIPVGHSPTALGISGDRQTLCVANRFDNSVDILNLKTDRRLSIPVVREPVALVLSSDEKHLFVANHLPCVRPALDDENPFIAAEISIIDVAGGRVVKSIELPNGSQGLRGIALSPDGRYVAVTHILSNYTVPTMNIAHGAMNRNAVSLLNTEHLDWEATVALDDPECGAANPWAVGFTEDSAKLLVTHAGTHELSVIDFNALLKRIATCKPSLRSFAQEELRMMDGIRDRIRLSVLGPRSMSVHGDIVCVAGYFSDDVAIVDLATTPPSIRTLRLEQRRSMPKQRLGERYFNDASLCFQKWQSCATCHPDGRSDALYWDLLNDGIGNTKNTKSLLMSGLTPPVMWRGVRPDARAAIQAGIHHIQFVEPEPAQADAIEEYLARMQVVPSPYLDVTQLESPKTDDTGCTKCHHPGVPRGTLTAAARRGKVIFEGKGGCVECHPHPTFTSQQTVDPGLGAGVAYDIPSLVEAWRTAPYLHAGDSLDLHETITDFNFLQKRGNTKSLSPGELSDLLRYLQSL